MTWADRYLKIVEKHLDNMVKKDEIKCANCDKPLTKNGAVRPEGYVQHIIRTNDQLQMRIYCGSVCCYLHLAAQIEHIQKTETGR